MLEILKLLAPLAIVVIINIALGLYYKIGVENVSFDKKILLNGIIKALIVAGSFVGLAYVFDTVSLGDVSVNPKVVMIAAIGIYAVKGVANLAKIFGVTLKTDSTENTITNLQKEDETAVK